MGVEREDTVSYDKNQEPARGLPAFVLLNLELGNQPSYGKSRMDKPHHSRFPHRKARLDSCSSSGANTSFFRCPTSADVYHLLALAVLLLVLQQAWSLFGAQRTPNAQVRSAQYVDLTEMLTGAAIGSTTAPQHRTASSDAAHNIIMAAAVQRQKSRQLSQPLLIPRILHQAYHTDDVPPQVRAVMTSWVIHHSDQWQLRFYDTAARHDFVAREFPRFLWAYTQLPTVSAEHLDEACQSIGSVHVAFMIMIITWQSACLVLHALVQY